MPFRHPNLGSYHLFQESDVTRRCEGCGQRRGADIHDPQAVAQKAREERRNMEKEARGL